MRTRPSNIINACPYCDYDHDPANQCREMPESVRFQLNERVPEEKVTERITDNSGKLVGVRTGRRKIQK